MNAWSAFGSLASLARNRLVSAIPSAFAPSTRFFSKYISKSAKKRLVLTTKRAHKGFYKGNRGTKEGSITSKAKFIVDPLKRMQIVAPDLEGFKVRTVDEGCYTIYSGRTPFSIVLMRLSFLWQLKPYIASNASRFPPEGRI